MADDDEEDQRTEAPSERRLQSAFESGDIPLSREAVNAGALAAGVTALAVAASSLQGSLTHLVAQTMTLASSAPFAALPGLLIPVSVTAAAVVLAAAGTALAFTFVQTRGHLWTEKAEPDLSRVFDASRVTRFVTRDFYVDLLVALLKVGAMTWIAWAVLRSEVWSLGKLLHTAAGSQLSGLFGPLSKATLRALGLIVAFAAIDFVLVRLRYTKRHRMTKNEVRREVREDEGDPHIRGARKRRHRELVKRNAIADTRRADAVIVNPTHIAVAVRYRKDEGNAPKVLAKGKGVLAEAMRDAARSSGIPIVQNIALARLLYKKVKVGGSVPAETYKAVAAVLAVVYRMTGRVQSPSSEVKQ